MYCGLDWAENHHDIALVNEAGELLAKQRITDDAAGYKNLLDLLAEHRRHGQAERLSTLTITRQLLLPPPRGTLSEPLLSGTSFRRQRQLSNAGRCFRREGANEYAASNRPIILILS